MFARPNANTSFYILTGYIKNETLFLLTIYNPVCCLNN